MLKEFQQFLLRGNVVDLAVGVVIGSAFGAVVTSMVADILTPMISAIAKIPDFSGLIFTLNGSTFAYGKFLNVLISFILVGASVFFFVVKPMNMLINRNKKEKIVEPTTKNCTECISVISINARRCPHCTQVLGQ
jgi:large conductance mechanosensitive channel